MRLARANEKGFTLIEFLVAIVIIAVGLLGLLQTVNFSIDRNMTTLLRDEAVRLADERMMREKSKVFTAISTNTVTENVAVNVANAFKNYSVAKTTSEVTSNTKNIQIDVTWRYKGQNYGHTMSSLVSKTIQ